MKLCTAMQEGRGYKDTLRAHRYFVPLAKYFTMCITYEPAIVFGKGSSRQSRCWQIRAYGDTESSERFIGLAHGQMTVKVGETVLAVLLKRKCSVSSGEETNLGRQDRSIC